MKSKANSRHCIILTLLALSFPCLAQTGPNPPPDEPPPGPPPPPPCDCCPETMTIANASVHFRQGFGRSPWISGALKGYLSVHEAVPGPRLGTRAMLCYDHALESRVVRRDAALGEVTVRNAMGVSTKYGSGGKPVKTLLSLDSQCFTNLNGEVVEQLPDRTRIVYGQMNAPVRIVTPDGVEAAAADFGVDVVKDLGGIRQIWSRTDGLLDMTEPSANSVLVSWYPPAAVAQQPGTNGVYTFSGNPLKTFTFIRTPQTGTTGYGLVLEERRGTSFLFTYEWKYMIGDGAWTLIRGQGSEMATERVVRPPDIYPGRILQTRTVSSADGKVSSAVSELYSYDSHGYTLLKKSAVMPDGREQVLFVAARADTGATAGLFSSVTNAYGGAESYLYDSDGRMTRKTETLQGGVTQVTTNTYASARDAQGFIDRRPARTVVTQNGVAVSDTAYVYSGTFESVTRTDPKTGASLTALKYLYSPASANTIEQGRVKITVNPDGSATLHAYASGDNGSWTETVTQGCWTPAFLPPGQSYMPPADITQLFSELPGKSTRTVNTHDFRGDIVRTDSYVHTGAEFSLAGWETHSYSVMHKKIGTVRHDGTSEMSNWICSGPVWQRNADGTSVTNTFDTAKRIKTSTRYTPFGNVAKTYSYDADGRVVSQTTATNGVTIGCGVGCGTTYTDYDIQGRVLLSVDAMGRTNLTAYSLDNRMVTRTDPAGAIVVENYGTDGSLMSRTGTVMRAEYYTQGVDAATGTRWEKTTYSSPVGADYTKSHYNALGQLVLQERPGFGGATLKTVYAYNTKGQLESESRIVQGGTGSYELPVTTYAYNQLGTRVSTLQTLANLSRGQSYERNFTVEEGVVQLFSVSVKSCSDGTICTMTNVVTTRLYPLEKGLLSELRSRDERGNETMQTISQNPATYVLKTTISNTVFVLADITVSLAGLTVSRADRHGCITAYTYDVLGRQTLAETLSGASNERRVANSTHYNAIGQVDYTEDALGTRTIYGYDSIGRRVSESKITQSGNNAITQFFYDQGNRTLATWGATYPVAYEYDTAGRMTAMYTYRGTNSIASYSDIAALKPEMDCTQWFYDQATGLLTNKLYADGKGPSYSYTALGQLSSRTWARPSSTGQQLLTQYKYDGFGSLTNTVYSDGTPSVSITYNALGQMKTVTDASGVRSIDYDTDGQVISENLAFSTSLFTLHEKYDNLGRNRGYALSNGVALVTGTIQSYDTFGRLNQIAVDGIDNVFTYSYLEDSHLQKTLAMPNGVTRTFGYEPNRDLLTMIVHSNATERLVQRTFSYDGLGRLNDRTLVRASGSSSSAPDAFGYNIRSELTNAVINANAFAYNFDPIGNRTAATEFGTNTSYVANALNQYSSLQPKDLQPIELSYDADGNQTLLKTTTGIWRVWYNAENRPVLFSNDTTVVEMDYDYMGRRFEYRETVNGTLTRHERYLYRGYLQIVALDMLLNASVKHVISWDPTEPTATRPLALQIGTATYYYSFDQVKNVTELFDSTGVLAVTYDYSPFGQITSFQISQSGTNALSQFSNPLTFSSEIHDSTLGLQYYNYRHLIVLDGRWMNRDPINEFAFIKSIFLKRRPVNSNDIYAFCHNNTNTDIDSLGLMTDAACKEIYDAVLLEEVNTILEVKKNYGAGKVKCINPSYGPTRSYTESVSGGESQLACWADKLGPENIDQKGRIIWKWRLHYNITPKESTRTTTCSINLGYKCYCGETLVNESPAFSPWIEQETTPTRYGDFIVKDIWWPKGSHPCDSIRYY